MENMQNNGTLFVVSAAENKYVIMQCIEVYNRYPLEWVGSCGCTEIPLLVSQDQGKIPFFDTTTIHARAAVEYALSDSSR